MTIHGRYIGSVASHVLWCLLAITSISISAITSTSIRQMRVGVVLKLDYALAVEGHYRSAPRTDPAPLPHVDLVSFVLWMKDTHGYTETEAHEQWRDYKRDTTIKQEAVGRGGLTLWIPVKRQRIEEQVESETRSRVKESKKQTGCTADDDAALARIAVAEAAHGFEAMKRKGIEDARRSRGLDLIPDELQDTKTQSDVASL